MSSAFHWLLNYTSIACPSFQHSNCLAPTNRYIEKNLATHMNADIIAMCISAYAHTFLKAPKRNLHKDKL